MVITATGHRPTKLFIGDIDPYGQKAQDILMEFAVEKIRELGEIDYHFISGMALGWDQAVARAALRLGFTFTAAIPFFGQESKWPKSSQREYRDLIHQAKEVVTVSDGRYAPWKMQVRNEWMVDRADVVLALWDGSNGGTANCVRYAEKNDANIINVWKDWIGER